MGQHHSKITALKHPHARRGRFLALWKQMRAHGTHSASKGETVHSASWQTLLCASHMNIKALAIFYIRAGPSMRQAGTAGGRVGPYGSNSLETYIILDGAHGAGFLKC